MVLFGYAMQRKQLQDVLQEAIGTNKGQDMTTEERIKAYLEEKELQRKSR